MPVVVCFGDSNTWGYDPVTGTTALWVLLISTVSLLAVGMFLFRRIEFEVND